MIADKDKTYVVEFLDNKVVAVEKKGNEQIMTNYYINYEKFKNNGIKYTEGSMGIKRYNILRSGLLFITQLTTWKKNAQSFCSGRLCKIL